jgi:hypothetical protein
MASCYTTKEMGAYPGGHFNGINKSMPNNYSQCSIIKSKDLAGIFCS